MEQMKLTGFQLIKGEEHAMLEKLVAAKANQLLIVVDETKLVQNLNQSFLYLWKSFQMLGSKLRT